MLDIYGRVCYYNIRKRKEATKMAYSIEYYEIMGDAMDEVREWEDFEADMATDPYGF